MSNFLTDVLEVAGKYEKEESSVRFQKILSLSEELKSEIYSDLKESDENVVYASAEDVENRLHELVADWSDFNSGSEQMLVSLGGLTKDFESVEEQIFETGVIINNLEKLTLLNSLLESLANALSLKDYGQAVLTLKQLESALDGVSANKDDTAQIYFMIKKKYEYMKNRILSDLLEAFRKLLKWHLPSTSPGVPSKWETTARMIFPTGIEALPDAQSVLQAMSDMQILQDELKTFADKFSQFFLKPTIVYADCKIKVTETPDQMIEISYSVKPGLNQPIGLEPSGTSALLLKVLEFVNHRLLSKTVKTEEQQVSLMRIMASFCSRTILEEFTTNCLMQAIPSHHEELKDFETVLAQVQQFQTALIEIGFLDNNDPILPDFINNINILFVDKKCQLTLEKGRTLMSSSLHNTVQVGTVKMVAAEALESSSMDTTQTSNDTPVHLHFPRCHVSDWTEQVISLAYDTLKEATVTNPQCAKHLFYAVHSLFKLFSQVTPVCHKDEIADVPQITAIHHNNCMYMTHHMMTLGPQFMEKLSDPLNHGSSAFVDLVITVRRQGAESLLEQITKQKDQLLEFVIQAKDFANVSESQNFETVERSFKQVMHNLHHLMKVWHRVLPTTVYFKTIGALLNAVFLEVLPLVIGLEDISTDDAVQLNVLLSVLTDGAPELFTVEQSEDPPEALLQHYVKQWVKVNQLKMILTASLMEISDQWADGKGIFAKDFSATELKQLIRALFQNTDRRAAVLARIR